MKLRRFNFAAEDREQGEAERYLLMLYRQSQPELRAQIVEAAERAVLADLKRLAGE